MRATYGKARHRKKRRIFRKAKGFWGARHRLWRTAKQSVVRSQQHAFIGRKQRKRDFRRLWITRLNAACRARGSRALLTESRHPAEKTALGLDMKVLFCTNIEGCGFIPMAAEPGRHIDPAAY